MTLFLLDQILFALCGLGIMYSIPLVFPYGLAILLEVITFCVWGYLCKNVILLPVDLLVGKTTSIAVYNGKIGSVNFEFFRKKNYYIYKFSGENVDLHLIDPFMSNRSGIGEIDSLRKGQLVKISYFRFSKLLCDYSVL